MLLFLGKYWWSFLLRGVLATLFGLALLFLPGVTIEFLLMLLALFLIIDGAISSIASLKGRLMKTRWQYLFVEGTAGILTGILSLFWPQMTVLVIAVIVGVWAFVTGAFEILAAVKLRHELEGEWLLGATGVLSILLGTLLFLHPELSINLMLMILGVYSVIFGVSLIVLGAKLRKRSLVISL